MYKDASFLPLLDDLVTMEMFARSFRVGDNKDAVVSILEVIAFHTDYLFPLILVHSIDRESIVVLMLSFLENDESLRKECIIVACEEPGGHLLFDILREHDLLHFFPQFGNYLRAGHTKALEWIEANGVEIDINSFDFLFHVRLTPEILAHFWRKMSIRDIPQHLLETIMFDSNLVKMILEVKGAEELRNIPIEKIVMDFPTVKLVQANEYDFDKEKLAKEKQNGQEISALLCFDVLKYSNLSESQKNAVWTYVWMNDVKVCKSLLPFFRPVRKRKMKMVILCFRRLYGKSIPKEIVWKILDYCYSPGSLKY